MNSWVCLRHYHVSNGLLPCSAFKWPLMGKSHFQTNPFPVWGGKKTPKHAIGGAWPKALELLEQRLQMLGFCVMWWFLQKVRSFEVHAVWINASWSVWVNLPVPSWCMDSQPSKAKCLRRKLLHILHIASGGSQAWYNGFPKKRKLPQKYNSNRENDDLPTRRLQRKPGLSIRQGLEMPTSSPSATRNFWPFHFYL